MRCRGVDETNCITRGSSQPSDRAPIERVFTEHLVQALDTGDPAMRTADRQASCPPSPYILDVLPREAKPERHSCPLAVARRCRANRAGAGVGSSGRGAGVINGVI